MYLYGTQLLSHMQVHMRYVYAHTHMQSLRVHAYIHTSIAYSLCMYVRTYVCTIRTYVRTYPCAAAYGQAHLDPNGHENSTT